MDQRTKRKRKGSRCSSDYFQHMLGFVYGMFPRWCEISFESISEYDAVLICIWFKNSVQNESTSSNLVAGFPYKNVRTLVIVQSHFHVFSCIMILIMWHQRKNGLCRDNVCLKLVMLIGLHCIWMRHLMILLLSKGKKHVSMCYNTTCQRIFQSVQEISACKLCTIDVGMQNVRINQ